MNGFGRVWERGSLVHVRAVPEEVPLRVYCVLPVQTEVVMQYRCSLPGCINRHRPTFSSEADQGVNQKVRQRGTISGTHFVLPCPHGTQPLEPLLMAGRR